MISKSKFSFVTVAVFCGGFIAGSFVQFSPSEDAINDMADDFTNYYQAHGRLPPSLSDLGPDSSNRAARYGIVYDPIKQTIHGGLTYSTPLSRLFMGSRIPTAVYSLDLKAITGNTEQPVDSNPH